MKLKPHLTFDAVGFSTASVYYRMEDDYLYHFGYVDYNFGEFKFSYYDGFLPRDKTIPSNLPTQEEVITYYKSLLEEKGVHITNDIVLAG